MNLGVTVSSFVQKKVQMVFRQNEGVLIKKCISKRQTTI